MAALREAIQRFKMQPDLRPCRAPEKLATVRAELEQRLGQTAIKQPDTERLPRTYDALKKIIDNNNLGMESLSISELKVAPWVIFEPIREGIDPLAFNKDFLDAYLKEVILRSRSSVSIALLAAFLMIYPMRLPLFDHVRKALLLKILPQAKGPRADKWRACVNRCYLLEDHAHEKLAGLFAAGDTSLSNLLVHCCLDGLLSSSVLVEMAYRVWIGNISGQLRNQRITIASLERLLTFSKAPNNPKELRYQSSYSVLANGLLLPFVDASPGPDVAQRIKGFLLDTLGDPRLTGAKRWHGVDERARAVMLRWVVAATLEDFFRLLEYAAEHDGTAARHWKDRKAFWSGYLHRGHIHDAWVALGPKAKKIKTHSSFSTESQGYAELVVSSGVLKNHSAIIMRIGAITVTEWSHKGKFRAWYPNNRYIPKLHKVRYERSQLVNDSNVEIIHHGQWQKKISDLIYQQTGIA